MRIVHIVYSLGLGGIETMLVNIANVQSASGNDVHIIIINNIVDDSLTNRLSPGVTVHRLGRKQGSKNPRIIFKLNNTVRQIHPDIIHLHNPSINRYLFKSIVKAPVCATLHSMCTSDNTKSIKSVEQIFAISDLVRKDLAEKHGIDAVVVYNGIDPTEIIAKDSGKEKDIYQIVNIGRLSHSIKGQDVLVRAAKHLLEKGVSNFHITFIGEGESYDHLTSLAREHGVGDYITFLGAKSQEYIFEHLSDYDLFVQPSRFEGFGLTVLEAMAAKLPVLVADNSGMAEVIGKDEFGVSFQNGDAKDCAEKIESFITMKINRNMIDEAYSNVLKNYMVKDTAARYLIHYKDLIDKHHSEGR